MKVNFNTALVLDIPDDVLLRALAGNGIELESVADVTDADLEAVLCLEDFGLVVLDKARHGVKLASNETLLVYVEPTQ